MQPDNDPYQPPESQVIKPEEMFNPSVQVGPPAPSAPSGPTAPTPQGPSDLPPLNSDPGLKKRILIVVGGLVGLFVIVLIIVVVLSSNNNNKQNNNQNAQNNQNNGILNPPSAIDIQNANNSITSDISSLNDDNDFPTASLSDNNLHL